MYLALQRYSRPSDAETCLRLLHEAGERTALLSGGTDLHAGGHEALTHVIDLQALPLDAIAADEEGVRLGARVTLSRVRRAPELASTAYAALREAAGGYAIVALQNRATLGGRIASDRPDQDVPTALHALGARVRIARLPAGRVEEEVIDYPTGEARGQLVGALVTEVLLPGGIRASALRRFGRTAVDVPLASAAACRTASGAVRVAVNLQGPSAAQLKRLAELETYASTWGDAPPPNFRDQARGLALDDTVAWADAWASGAYRQDLTATLAVRALCAVFGQPEIA